MYESVLPVAYSSLISLCLLKSSRRSSLSLSLHVSSDTLKSSDFFMILTLKWMTIFFFHILLIFASFLFFLVVVDAQRVWDIDVGALASACGPKSLLWWRHRVGCEEEKVIEQLHDRYLWLVVSSGYRVASYICKSREMNGGWGFHRVVMILAVLRKDYGTDKELVRTATRESGLLLTTANEEEGNHTWRDKWGRSDDWILPLMSGRPDRRRKSGA